MSPIHEQSIEIRDVPTKVVTFYPQKAEIVREIPDVKLKHGFNEITITGITPIADENSIKVEARGSTTVTDMVVELITNPDHFEDVYGSDTENEDSDSEDEPYKPTEEVKALQAESDKLAIKQDAHQETIDSNLLSLSIIERLIEKLEVKDPEEVRSSITIYREQRAKFYQDMAAAKDAKAHIDKQRTKLDEKIIRLEQKHHQAHDKKLLKKLKVEAKRKRQEARQQNEKKRIAAERAKFWPKKTYKVKVTIEASVMTPGISRRDSFESLASANTVSVDNNVEPTNTSLLLTYIVRGASWTPKYDLSISTVSGTGTMNYRAEIENSTSETWTDAKIVLSTSRSTFSGVSEPIPVIKPWLLQLQKIFGGYVDAQPTLSTQEKNSAAAHRPSALFKFNDAFNRQALFGVSDQDSLELQDYQIQSILHEQKLALMSSKVKKVAQAPVFGQAAFGSMAIDNARAEGYGQMPQVAPGSVALGAAPFSNQVPGNRSWGGGRGGGAQQFSQQAVPPPPPPASAMAAKPAFARRKSKAEFRDIEAEVDEDEEKVEDDDASGNDEDDSPGWEESGLTTNLELRGKRTIEPSSNKRRFKIATIRLNQLTLTHMVVPKLRAEAFLRARIVNSSATALLKGSAGLTLDGTFLGHTTIPRCSAGENFPLPLGIDPAIAVSYPTPVTRKNIGGGMFNKDQSTTFTRTVVLTNTRTSGAAVSVTVKDQVPVSEDERLKIEITTPRGLTEEGDRAKAGTEYLSAQTAKIGQSSASAEGKKTADKQPWGQAVAKLTKFGIVEWTVSLNAGKAVRLTLEYTIKFPGSDRVTEAFRAGGFDIEESDK